MRICIVFSVSVREDAEVTYVTFNGKEKGFDPGESITFRAGNGRVHFFRDAKRNVVLADAFWQTDGLIGTYSIQKDGAFPLQWGTPQQVCLEFEAYKDEPEDQD